MLMILYSIFGLLWVYELGRWGFYGWRYLEGDLLLVYVASVFHITPHPTLLRLR